jgi:hypothetical protein
LKKCWRLHDFTLLVFILRFSLKLLRRFRAFALAEELPGSDGRCLTMKLLLIAPTVEPERYPKGGYAFRVANYNLPLLAALTPPDVEIHIIDECAEPITFEEGYDLVGITVNTPLAPYSYELSTKFRERGSRVVLGGIHPSVLPEESLKHADAVVVGEAEPVWASLIRDFQEGHLQRLYRAPQARLETVPVPRWDLMQQGRYIINRSLTASRGCVYHFIIGERLMWSSSPAACRRRPCWPDSNGSAISATRGLVSPVALSSRTPACKRAFP